MRLLTYNNTGSFSLIDYPSGTNLPPYAILSHTWGPEEVTYRDIEQGVGQDKKGYEKIRFCGEQARRDGLQHFWVDTCCIDKSSSAELTESINSMFRWYRDAAKCYAYLEDVSIQTTQDSDRHNEHLRLQFKQSRWFTRGWTLQELIAPKTVDFYSREGTKTGDKESLESLICDLTGIPAQALRGEPLSHFTTSERMSHLRNSYASYLRRKRRKRIKTASRRNNQSSKRQVKIIRRTIIESLMYAGGRHEEFTIPFSLYDVPEIVHFVARGPELAKMRETLRSDGSRRTVVLHGLGGMGKTQLAIEYMKQNKDNYSAVFWLNIKDGNSLKQSFTRIARQIKQHHPEARHVGQVNIEGQLDETVDAVKAWLSLPNHTRWLLVYDNYDNPKLSDNADPAAVDIQKYLPEAYQGSVVITTRSSRVEIGHTIRMAKLESLEHSLELLSTTSKREKLIDDPDAVDLAKELDGLPLALATAGAYLEQTSTSFRSYLRLYKESWARLQTSSPKLPSYEDRTLYSTWQLSFNRVQQENKHAAELLRLWAYFDSQDLWLELLQSYKQHRIEWIRETTKDELSFSRTVRKLIEYGFVEINSSVDDLIESRGYSVHSCVHSWMANVLNQEWSVDLARFAVACIASHAPGRDMDKWWVTQRRLLQHAGKYSIRILDEIIENDTSWVFFRLGNLYFNEIELEKAEEMYHRALQGTGQSLGPNDTLTLAIVHSLGTLYRRQIRLKEAEEMFHRAMEGTKKALGPNDTSILDITHNLGVLYRIQGKAKEAEDMYDQALQGADLYRAQGRLKEAERALQRALQSAEKVFGPDHTLTLNTVYHLGMLYDRQNKPKEAEQMLLRALRGYEAALGSNHYSTQSVFSSIQQLRASKRF
ncbi:hypothetical protein O1611_g7025 [Lasiodiplodia mahajangana]|uniref:Uncharacterized protein n=1 Tax=Lasiodiplodia mahajangana TaxID=1108764 RepID=A0ACC2JGR6_9PEZI|nr:hypothetical protein O1611_g7025 [Lasiodiplodia mahajangana]